MRIFLADSTCESLITDPTCESITVMPHECVSCFRILMFEGVQGGIRGFFTKEKNGGHTVDQYTGQTGQNLTR